MGNEQVEHRKRAKQKTSCFDPNCCPKSIDLFDAYYDMDNVHFILPLL